ncbi:MAG: hypothetical protein GXO74_11905 [Calditrichaeota bacterium]|nr:hypothetical protein [Calditrichota bacterium]
MGEKKNYFATSKFLLEMFSVIFAILLALVVNEWRTSHANKILAHEALLKIRREISSNHEIVHKLLNMNKLVKKNQLKAYNAIKKEIRTNSSHNIEDHIKQKFPFQFMTQALKKTAWNSSNLTHAVEFFDFSIVEVLSETYEDQKLHTRVNEKILDRLASPGLFKKETMISEMSSFFMLLEMYFQITESLLKEYENCLRVIDAQLSLQQ